MTPQELERLSDAITALVEPLIVREEDVCADFERSEEDRAQAMSNQRDIMLTVHEALQLINDQNQVNCYCVWCRKARIAGDDGFCGTQMSNLYHGMSDSDLRRLATCQMCGGEPDAISLNEYGPATCRHCRSALIGDGILDPPATAHGIRRVPDVPVDQPTMF